MDTIHTIGATQGQQVRLGTDVVTIKAGSDTTAGSMLVFELRVPPGGRPAPLHRHGYSEVFYVLDGAFEVRTLDGDNHVQATTLTAGDTIAIPSMVWHTFTNGAATASTLLAIHSPPVMEGLIHELGRPIDNPDDLTVPVGPPSDEERDAFMRIIGTYMEFLPAEMIAP